jgi:hypothetical protein
MAAMGAVLGEGSPEGTGLSSNGDTASKPHTRASHVASPVERGSTSEVALL